MDRLCGWILYACVAAATIAVIVGDMPYVWDVAVIVGFAAAIARWGIRRAKPATVQPGQSTPQ